METLTWWRVVAGLIYKKILDFISPDAIITDRNEKIEVLKVENSNYEKPHKHPALIMCTSGTTGVPKGVMLSEKNIITNVSDITSYFVLDKMVFKRL